MVTSAWPAALAVAPSSFLSAVSDVADRLSYGTPGSTVIRKRFGTVLLHMQSLPDFVAGTPASQAFQLAVGLADKRAFGRLCWRHTVPSSQSDVEVCECAVATDGPPGGCRCYPRASLLPATLSCACITLVPQITLTCVPQRAQAVLGASERPSSRAGSLLQMRRHVEVSAGPLSWMCWDGSGSARIPVGGVRASRDARAFVLAISTTSPK